jgi:hypothetical protein
MSMTRRTPRRFGNLIGFLAVTLMALPAHAFRTLADKPDLAGSGPIVWKQQPIQFMLHDAVPASMTREAVADAVAAAFRTWAETPCAQITSALQGWTDGAPAPNDGVNTIGWVTQGWDTLGANPNAAGYTDVAVQASGEGGWTIVEADIYLNAERFSWSIGSGAQGDVRSVLLHEIGHLWGLAHVCEDGGGNGIVDCAADPSLSKIVMHPDYDPTRLALAEDDQRGVCTLYPTAPTCEPACAKGETCTREGCVAMALRDAGEIVHAKGGWLEVGDPCSSHDECVSKACAAGACRPRCRADSDCAQGDTCELDTGGASLGGTCKSARRAMGEPCTESNQCLGNQCLAGSREGDICTRACGEGHAACPAGWSCNEVQGREVCAQDGVGGGGCQITRGAEPHGSWGAIACAAIAGLGRARQRRRDQRTNSHGR